MDKKNVVYALGIVALSSGIAFAEPTALPGRGVVGSAHDMRTYTDNGASITEIEDRVCAFCHTPHHATTGAAEDYLPLWSHTLASTVYSAYDSATIDATIDPATMMEGPSKLCMSCHDGLVAIDTHYSTTGRVTLPVSDGFGEGGIGAAPATLTNDHPIGFIFDADDGGIAAGPPTGDPTTSAPSTDGQDKWIRTKEATYLNNIQLRIQDRLYETANGPIMTCATCHDVHNKKNKYDNGVYDPKNYLLLSPNKDSQLCLSCHIK